MSLAALAIGSTALTAFGSLYSGYTQKEASKQQAQLFLRSAEEQKRRLNMNIDLIERERDQLIGTQTVVAAGQGKALTGSVMNLMYDTKQKAAQEILKQQSIAEFEISNLHLKASLQEYYGDTAMVAGMIGAAGSITQGAYSYYK